MLIFYESPRTLVHMSADFSNRRGEDREYGRFFEKKLRKKLYTGDLHPPPPMSSEHIGLHGAPNANFLVCASKRMYPALPTAGDPSRCKHLQAPATTYLLPLHLHLFG